MKLTREQAIKEHRKMWNWLAEHPEKWKDDYFEIYHEKFGHIFYDCFLCEYNHQNSGYYCGEDCLCDWGEVNDCIGSSQKLGLYGLYCRLKNHLYCIDENSVWSKDIIEGLQLIISRIARAIAELPENKVGEEE